VVSGKKVNGDPLVRQIGQAAKNAGKSTGNNFPVFKPEIENIAQQVKFGYVVANTIEPAGKQKFAFAVVGKGRRPKVNIRNKIDIFSFWQDCPFNQFF
jgi:hypothetical protein